MWRVWYLKHRVREILENKDGVGVVEIILILVEKPNAKHRYVLCGN